MNRYLKFIIFDGEPNFGYVEYHRHLLPKNVRLDDPRIKGGGMVSINGDVFLMHGDSSDFGKFDSELLRTYFECNNYAKNFSLWYIIRCVSKSECTMFRFQEMDELHNIKEYKTSISIDKK